LKDGKNDITLLYLAGSPIKRVDRLLEGAVIEERRWFALSVDDCLRELEVDPSKGLSSDEAQVRLDKYGRNELAAGKKESVFMAFLRQYRSLMQLVLVGTALAAIVVKNWSSVAILLLVTLFNALLGLRQEGKAKKSVEALQQMMMAEARVRRYAKILSIPATELVPGDIILLREGDRIPADGRVVSAATLEAEESSLTGESIPVLKTTEPISAPDVPLGDRTNMVFMNTNVTRGRAEVLVTGTGMSTEVGHIADSLREKKKETTPLTRQIDTLIRVILVIAAAAFIVVMVVGSIKGKPFNQLFTAGVALIIGAIPAGLPAVVTTILSVGTVSLAKMNAIVKNLPSAETLGSVSAICTDKTGTLTMNQMTVRELVLPGARYKVTGQGYGFEGEILHAVGQDAGPLDVVLMPMVVCSDANVMDGKCVGDPNECALITLAAKRGIDAEETRMLYPRIASLPFDSEYMLMATFHEMEDESGNRIVRCFVKGAPDIVLSRSSSIRQWDGHVLEIDQQANTKITEAFDSLAADGLRELAVASRDLAAASFNPSGDLLADVRDLTLLAVVGIADPPRAEAGSAIEECKQAGIRVRMITGDHIVTARAVAEELGIEGNALSGADFEMLDDVNLQRQIEEIGVVARVAPRDKVRMVEVLQGRGEIVAMTGDGVNDAPALKTADVGVAMGVSGTDVSKEAAAMILTDDNFTTIVNAVSEGRSIYDNLMKFIRLQMSNLAAFILGFLLTGLIASTALFNPLQILWIKFGSLVPVGAVLAYDTAAPGIMRRKPRAADQPVLDLRASLQIFLMGLILAGASIAVRQWSLHHYGSDITAQTMAFAVFATGPIVFALNLRFPDQSLFHSETLTNPKLWYAFLWCLFGVILLTQTEIMRGIFKTSVLTASQWLICLSVTVVIILLGDLIKLPLRFIPSKSIEPPRG
jgi:P-type Ca2+ transporter type 2C